MRWRSAVAVVFAAVTAVCVSSGTLAAAENWIQLRDGVQARFLTALKVTAPSKAKTLSVSFVLHDAKIIADHAKAIDVADQLFGRVVLVTAEEKEYQRAVVNLLKAEEKSGVDTVQVFEDFHYARGSNGVWLRQAGPQAWKTAQDPSWSAPQPEVVQLSNATVNIDFVGEILPPTGATKALGVDMYSATPVTNIPAKYREIREIWNRLNHAKLTEGGFDFVHIGNYGEPLRGKFHVRKRVYVDITRQPDGTWPELPETAPLKDSSEPLVAGLGLRFEDDAERLAAQAVASIVPVSNRSEDAVDGLTSGIAISSRRLLATGGTVSSALDYLKP